jgi:MYXO-CTERM domain-containing protein
MGDGPAASGGCALALLGLALGLATRRPRRRAGRGC